MRIFLFWVGGNRKLVEGAELPVRKRLPGKGFTYSEIGTGIRPVGCRREVRGRLSGRKSVCVNAMFLLDLHNVLVESGVWETWGNTITASMGAEVDRALESTKLSASLLWIL